LNRIRLLNPNVVGASKAEQELVKIKADLDLASETISQLETLLASERFKNAQYKEDKDKLMKLINEKQAQLNDVRERSPEEGSVSQALLSMIQSLSELPPKVQKYVIDSISGEANSKPVSSEDKSSAAAKRKENIRAGNAAYEEANEQIRSELNAKGSSVAVDQSEAAAELAGLMSAYNKLWAKFNAEISAHEALRVNNESMKEEIAELRGQVTASAASMKSLKNQVDELIAAASEERKLWEDAEHTWLENADRLELENSTFAVVVSFHITFLILILFVLIFGLIHKYT
jgi:chromosome segregation ATPase